MPLPYLKHQGVKLAPFKTTGVSPFGAFENTTPPGTYPVAQTKIIDGQSRKFNWPSSEHAYHAQKIIALKEKLPANHPAQQQLTGMLDKIENTNVKFLPRDHYDKLVSDNLPALKNAGLNLQDKNSFDKLCCTDANGKWTNDEYMREVIRLKLDQHPQLKKIAMDCAREGIIPVEVSRYDSRWASGPDGKGENKLGLMILEEGNKLLTAKGETPAISNPKAAYQALKGNDLKHDNLVKRLDPLSGGWTIPTVGQPHSKWANLSSQATSKPSQSPQPSKRSQPLVFNPVPYDLTGTLSTTLSNMLNSGKIPIANASQTLLDYSINHSSPSIKKDIANLVVSSAVKSAMGNLHSSFGAQMVDNNRRGQSNHDNHAMKITFKSQQEAEEFCKKLADQGIHSHTFGPGVAKTAQNGSVFLTKQDLSKMSQAAGICQSDATAKTSYETIVQSIAEMGNKVANDQDEQENDTAHAHL